MKQIFIHHYIKEKYKLNNLKAISFEIFIANPTNNRLLQYVGGVVGIGKTQIIRTIQDYFLKTWKEQKLRLVRNTRKQILYVKKLIVKI